MAVINLEGKVETFRREKLVDQERYNAVFSKARYVPNVQTLRGVQNKIALDWEVEVDGRTAVLTMLCNTKVTKGSGTYSNSKLYDVFEKLKVLEHFAKFAAQETEIDDEKLIEWINSNIVGKKAVIEVRNINMGTDEEYSIIDKIVKTLK